VKINRGRTPQNEKRHHMTKIQKELLEEIGEMNVYMFIGSISNFYRAGHSPETATKPLPWKTTQRLIRNNHLKVTKTIDLR
jgi:hypothetical protein